MARIPAERLWKYPASLESVNQICAAAGQVLDDYLLSGGDRFAIHLLLREGLNNAVIHGCGGKADQEISCKLLILAEEIILEIRDAGEGFDWRNAVTASPDIDHESGRGLFIYKLYATSIVFNEPGSCVTLTRKIEGGVYARNPDQT